jgi:redox-sensitive bicupin YhaK (pirin superfamily)
MITIRKSEERGHFNHGWLDTYHTFSFGNYIDPNHMGFRSVRVINEDRVRPGEGFPTHSHTEMEIISYVLGGTLEHRDSMGNTSLIRPGEVQRMSAGTGITHSEYNHSLRELVHFLQIWIVPAQRGIDPEYEQTLFSEEERRGSLCRIASPDGREGSVSIHQDVQLFLTNLEHGEKVGYILDEGRHAWAQVTRGESELNGHSLRAGDGAAISGDREITLVGVKEAEILLFDLE